MIRILHFADAHIDIAAHGRHDPVTGLPYRALDFLKALDTIIDTAINEKVNLVIFAGDAYKDRTPTPTYQREWGKRMMRLSAARIPTILLVGNHDLSPASGRANALQEYDTLDVPFIRVVGEPELLRPGDMNGLPLQVLAMPWISRAGLSTLLQNEGAAQPDVKIQVESLIGQIVRSWLEDVDHTLPVVFTAHGSVQGARYGAERTVMLGSDVIIEGSLVRDRRLDYVALGHIHKNQNLNEGSQPPVVYPGSIERVDFGEAGDEKYFVIASVEKGNTLVDWRRLDGRKFIDRRVTVSAGESIQANALAAFPDRKVLKDAVFRLIIEYPYEMAPMLDDAALHREAEEAFEFHLIPRPIMQNRILIPEGRVAGSMTPLELLDEYWKTLPGLSEEKSELQDLASQIMHGHIGEDSL